MKYCKCGSKSIFTCSKIFDQAFVCFDEIEDQNFEHKHNVVFAKKLSPFFHGNGLPINYNFKKEYDELQNIAFKRQLMNYYVAEKYWSKISFKDVNRDFLNEFHSSETDVVEFFRGLWFFETNDTSTLIALIKIFIIFTILLF